MNTTQIQNSDNSGLAPCHIMKQSDTQALEDRILADLIGLPSMPHIVNQALEIIATEDLSLSDLASVIETDSAIAAKTLKVANSAYYGLSGRISSLQKAAALLGTRQLANIIMMAGVSTLLDKKLESYGVESGDLWRHSLAVAFGSRIISSRIAPDLMDNAFAAGLLHNIGKIALDRYILERKTAFDEFMQSGRHTSIEAEKRILGVDRLEIASEICKNWNFPKALRSAIRFCHYPSHSHGNELAYILHIADTLAEDSKIGTGSNDMMHQIEKGALEFLGLKAEHLEHILAEMVGAVEKTIETVTKN